jgi:hypothetical protein
MTVNYKLDAVLELRKFLWSELIDREIFIDTEYYSDNIGDTIIPIIPVQQSAELNQFLSGKKHIVYDKVGMSYEDNWLICCEQVLFTIYLTATMWPFLLCLHPYLKPAIFPSTTEIIVH